LVPVLAETDRSGNTTFQALLLQQNFYSCLNPRCSSSKSRSINSPLFHLKRTSCEVSLLRDLLHSPTHLLSLIFAFRHQ
jgi:hypothetical protein